MKNQVKYLIVLLASACSVSCEKEGKEPIPYVKPSLAFNNQVTIVDDSVKFEYTIINPSEDVINASGIEVYSKGYALLEKITIVSDKKTTASEIVKVKIKLRPSETYRLTIFLEVKNTQVPSIGSFEIKTLSPKWNSLKPFPGQPRSKPVSFVVGESVFVGLGWNSKNQPYNDFWEYKTTTNTWTKRKDFPGAARFDAIGFSLNGSGFVGGGRDLATTENSRGYVDFWKYDPTGDTWTQMNNLPVLYDPQPAYLFNSVVAYSQGAGVAYYGTGTDRGPWRISNVFAYNPITDGWTAKANYPLECSRLNAFMIGNKLYAGVSLIDGNSNFMTSRELHMYDPVTNTWIAKASLPLEANLGMAGDIKSYSFSIGDFGYMLFGSGQLWKYDAVNNAWSQDASTDLNYYDSEKDLYGVNGGITEVVGGKAYLGFGAQFYFDRASTNYAYRPASDWMVFDPSK